MSDEAEAYMDRMIGFSAPIFRGRGDAPRTPSGQRQTLLNEGYKKGFDYARSKLLMQVMEWLGADFYGWQTPIWMAHVATEEFKCGCSLSSDYDAMLTPRTCQKWDDSTQEQQMELFQNVYGYPYLVWRMRTEQEMRKAEAACREEQAKQERAATFNINPELLP